ncbi:MAG: LacI family DNA-binding transcriptional regulator [Lachnospiraceae bacterium]
MNISEIAKMAGVSTAAVSRYLNGGSLSQTKREQIQKVIKRTGYEPNAYARTLRTGYMNNIGVIVPKINSESVSEVTAGISTVLSKHNYMLFLGNTDNNEMKELDFLRIMQKNHLAGIILMGTIITPSHLRVFQECKIPIIIVGQMQERMPCIYHDDYHAARALTSLVLQNQKKNIAYISVCEEDIAVGKNRKQGIIDELNAHNLSLVTIESSLFTIDSGYEAMQRILNKNFNIDAVICATDSIAIGAMKAIHNAGYSIPEDMSVCGFGGNKIGAMLTPPLTTVKLYYKQAGMEAAKLLLDMIENSRKEIKEETAIKQLMLSYEILERESL